MERKFIFKITGVPVEGQGVWGITFALAIMGICALVLLS